MKYQYLIFCVLFITTSCKTDVKNDNNETTTEDTTTVTKPLSRTVRCYEYDNKKDTVSMKTYTQNDSIYGTLSYNFFEKDKNTGSISGKMIGEIMVLDYTFNSEGTSSVRQVAFKKNGKYLTEGYGESFEKDGKMVFKNVFALDFSGKTVLEEINCR